MSWRDTQRDYIDIITASLWNNMVKYIINHKNQHHSGGEQPVEHDLLQGFEPARHRKIYAIPEMEVFVIEM